MTHKLKEFLKLAEVTRARDLTKVMEGKQLQETRAEVFHLTPNQRGVLWEALIKFGVEENGKRLRGREEALVKLAKAAKSLVPKGPT